MFNIENYLENINCPSCSKDSYKILNNSNYSSSQKITVAIDCVIFGFDSEKLNL